MAQQLPHLSDWEQISTNVIRILGGNPSKFTLQGTNTYLLGQTSRRLLLDTGQGEKAWIDSVSSVLDSQTKKTDDKPTITTAILTHWHHDHIGGVKDLEALIPDVKVYKHLPTHDPDHLLDAERVLDITDGQRFQIDDGALEIEAIHTPGHAKDHMAFIITASPDPAEVGAIFTADNVLGHGTAVFEDLSLYLDSLALMKRRVQESVAANQNNNSDGTESKKHNTRPAFPGHGAVIEDAVSKIDEYIAHRRMREAEALNVLKYGTVKAPDGAGAGAGAPAADSITTVGESDSEGELGPPREVATGKEWTSMEMVKVIYRHYPENLYLPAEYGLLMVLEKLRKDGKVVKTQEGKWRASEKATL